MCAVGGGGAVSGCAVGGGGAVSGCAAGGGGAVSGCAVGGGGVVSGCAVGGGGAVSGWVRVQLAKVHPRRQHCASYWHNRHLTAMGPPTHVPAHLRTYLAVSDEDDAFRVGDKMPLGAHHVQSAGGGEEGKER